MWACAWATLATQLPLMFVGAAPASTGGGIKVTALALVFLAELGAFGKLLLILLMFVGRLGPITFLVALSSRYRSRPNDHPPGSIAVG